MTGLVRAAVAMLAITAAACGASAEDTATSSSAASTPAAAAHGLEGTWRTEPITVEEMTRTLRDHGLSKWVRLFEKNAPTSDAPTVLILEIRDGTWNLSGRIHGRAPKKIDYDKRFELDGNRVLVLGYDDDSNTLRWAIDGDRLALVWEATTYGRYKGVPEEVFQRALYQTAEFRRDD